jgi:hypothetical protein
MGKRVNGNGGYEIFMNDIFMEEMEKKCRNYPSKQSKPNRNPKNEEEIIKYFKKVCML